MTRRSKHHRILRRHRIANQRRQALTGHSVEALPPAALASSGGACGTSFTAAGPCAGRVGVDSALLAASVPRCVLGAELACGTCRAALVGGVLVLHIQARAALQGAVGACRGSARGVAYSCFVCVGTTCGA